ncbi:hypothetical protein AAVH_24468 [Aphelenchoides avenae]|nr:hypothetical protein AAVH_24468 [Aphelenchus avenae]
MSGEPPTTPADHSEASFDIILDDASNAEGFQVPNLSGDNRVVNKLLDVLRGTTEKEKKHQALGSQEVNVLDSQQGALFEEFKAKRDAMRDVLCDLLNGADFTPSGGALHVDMNALVDVLRAGFEQTCMNEKQLEALTDDNEARDRRMAELAEELARKSAAIDSLERAVENAHYEIRMLNDLLKIGEQEKDRKIAALDEAKVKRCVQKIQELEELQEIGNRGMAREIDALTKAVADEQANKKTLEGFVETQDQQMAAVAQV